jgi:HK97 gp10 family phage protein
MVKGLASLQRKLLGFPPKAEAAIMAAMEKSADTMVALMKNLVPKESGALRDSIGWTWGDPPKGSLVVAKSSPTRGGLRITIFAGNDEAFYARWVEFGTQATRAQPYFFPSYRALRRSAKSRVSRAISKAIKDGAK